MIRHLRIVIGSRRLADAARAAEWAKREVDRWISDQHEAAWFMSGGAQGPDTWGKEAAVRRGMGTVEYLLDGTRSSTGGASQGGRWTEEQPPAPNAGRQAWARWCLLRDEAMAVAAGRSLDAGWDVEALALIARWRAERPTRGTEYTVELLEKRRIRVARLYSPASASP